MAITDQDVQHLAKLANLALDASSLARMRSELETIVGHVAQLSEVDTAGVVPVANVSGLVHVTRTDSPGPLLPLEEILALAPQRSAAAILVPKVVER
jgi:aspartyl-tRNA(Asn)/glutamyl-tRNA(Gln) amidotransferase subunit C